MIFPSILPPITEDLSTYQTSCWHQEFFFFPPFLSVWTFALEVSSFFGSGPWNALMMFRFQLHWPSPKERWNSKSITNIPKSVKIQHFFFNLNAFIGCEFCNYTIKSSAGRIPSERKYFVYASYSLEYFSHGFSNSSSVLLVKRFWDTRPRYLWFYGQLIIPSIFVCDIY